MRALVLLDNNKGVSFYVLARLSTRRSTTTRSALARTSFTYLGDEEDEDGEAGDE